MKNLEIRPMSSEEAEALIGWTYPGEYSFYDAPRDVEGMAEVRAEHVRERKYFSALEDRDLVGFFELEPDGDTVEIGLGLRPDLTGQGVGPAFLEAGLAFARERFRAKRFRLRVATFNQRAIKVYERAGFVRDMVYMFDFYGELYEFVVMSRPADVTGADPAEVNPA